MFRSTPRSPRRRVSVLLAALAGTVAGLPSLVRADPPPLVLPPVPANTTPAKPATSQYSLTGAQQDIIDEPNGERVVAKGNARLQTSQFLVETGQDGQISLDQASGHAEATGAVQLTFLAIRALTHKVTYDTQTQTLASTELRMGKPPLYFDGESLTAARLANGDTQAVLIDPTMFFSEPDPFGLNIEADRAVYSGNNQDVTMYGALLRIGSVPFFYLPSYTQGREDQPPASLQFHIGFNSSLGGYLQTTTYWTKNPDYSPGLLLDYYSKRGVLAGPAFRYDYTDDPDWQQVGTLQSGFIHDTGDKGTDLNGNPIPTNRYFVDWEHQGTLDGLVDLTSSMYWWSDSYVLRDYRQGWWQNNQLPDNWVEAVNREDNSFISAFVRYRPDSFEVTQERLPEVRYDYAPSPLLDTTIFQEGQASYVQLVEESNNGTATLHSNRFDAYYGWRRPINISDFATITPVIGTRITQYDDTLNDQGQFTRVLEQFGADAEMRAIGRWDYDAPEWGINGIQHILRPVIMYRYIPGADSGQGVIPVIDQENFSPDPPMIDLDDTRNIDGLHSDNVLRYGFENLFQTRADNSGYGSRDLASFDVYNDIHFTRQPGENDYSDVWAALGLYPADWLSFNVDNRVDPTSGTESEIHTDTTVHDGDLWSASVLTDYLQHQIAQYGLELRYRVSERLQLLGRWRYDEDFGGLVEQTYGVRSRLGDSWDVQYSVSYNRGAQTQDGLGLDVRFTLLTN